MEKFLKNFLMWTYDRAKGCLVGGLQHPFKTTITDDNGNIIGHIDWKPPACIPKKIRSLF
ncbi:MAG: hypothetical protein COU08_01995 [Candidatus Harrisonbacteria bacterium CG10_big_fil_rev_8_21_14_0_10_42_17]|uniref:Uncharacterized protein n=1 Tax=Candidatus Harrisonbacteria bacterium CG10_big_fil_rev_8_21_14_0_10_42_17 TaxID=1974584 RepID=A0A2M6WI81_9BACT|nr:MAG: hypothetical protein COU08_01995 [Candidatus Harrisonbacteria bacterium CG10_big_fil_rev_8_21_14_0_10_42_17]